MKAIDVHCHLDDRKFDADRDEVINRCKEKLHAVITSGVDYAGNERNLAIADNEFIFATLGFAPVFSGKKDHGQVIGQILQRGCLGVGEVGLDYYWEKDPRMRELQKKVFIKFIELANGLNKPLVVHCREAMPDCLEILGRHADCTVVMHCFSGTQEEAKSAQESGYFISMATNTLFSKRHQRLINGLDLNNILVESDSPYLDPKRGRNEPHNVIDTIALISSVKGEDCADKIFRNSLQAFPGLVR